MDIHGSDFSDSVESLSGPHLRVFACLFGNPILGADILIFLLFLFTLFFLLYSFIDYSQIYSERHLCTSLNELKFVVSKSNVLSLNGYLDFFVVF